MSMSDTISDLLTRLRNAQNASKESVSVPFSKMKHSICQVLLNEGYVDKVDIDDNDKKNLNITLKYYEGKPVIEKISRISTSKGVMTDKEARKNNCGGEIICYVS